MNTLLITNVRLSWRLSSLTGANGSRQKWESSSRLPLRRNHFLLWHFSSNLCRPRGSLQAIVKCLDIWCWCKVECLVFDRGVLATVLQVKRFVSLCSWVLTMTFDDLIVYERAQLASEASRKWSFLRLNFDNLSEMWKRQVFSYILKYGLSFKRTKFKS